MRKWVCMWAVALAVMGCFRSASANGFRFRDDPTLPPQPVVPETTPAPAEDLPYTLGLDAFPAESGEDRRLLLSFLGDCTLGCNEIDHEKKKSIDYFVAQNGLGYCFDKVRYILEQDDLTVANLECVLSDTTDGLDRKTKKTYNFRAYASYTGILAEGSVEAVTLANNHSGDYGQPGFDATVKAIEESPIEWFGSTDLGGRAMVYENDGIRIGLVGSYYQYYWQHTDEMQALFDSLRAEGCQVIIGVIHGGVEYDKRHDDNQTKEARAFIQWGADIVIGHHPHVLQGYEVIDGVPVYYSLGNFVFAGNFNLKTAYTVIMQLALSFSEDGRFLGSRANFIPCRLSDHEWINRYQPFPVTGIEAVRAIKKMQYDTKPPYLIADYTENIGALQDFIPAVIRK